MIATSTSAHCISHFFTTAPILIPCNFTGELQITRIRHSIDTTTRDGSIISLVFRIQDHAKSASLKCVRTVDVVYTSFTMGIKTFLSHLPGGGPHEYHISLFELGRRRHSSLTKSYSLVTIQTSSLS